ncbi:cytochrome P450 [Lichenifustis flavocetrariae]|uniref:Cytochrome P450 n=1 Tax=Lichenifustis flavocetrariae TaxID=2949735 RepID=A0AA41YSL7_9HYPH|nr:cytochrome P450 [Lichenifustis flavocetrariae]MCW6507829.1 cytochrome P450 [Lichenifustis flavocetrariae]
MSDTAAFPTLEGFDPFSPAFLSDPAPMIRKAQATTPAFYYPPLRMWVLTAYDDICRAARDWETFSSKAMGTVPPPDDLKHKIPETFVDDHYIAIDPPEHTSDRTAVARSFLPRELAKQEVNIRRIANELINTFIDKGSCDFMQEFCYPLSLGVIIELLGVPPERAADYRIWTEDLFAVLTPKSKDAVSKPMSEEERRERWTRLAAGQDFFGELVEERARCPMDDLISVMLTKDANGKQAVPSRRIIRQINELVAAGNDTTANLMGQMLLFLAENPEQDAEVRANPDLLRDVVEETLRRRGTSPGLFRITKKDVEIGGATIPEGSLVWLLYIAGGLDETRFPDAERFDIHRPNKEKHLAFGHGRHSCLGNPLARLEARAAFEELFKRIPDIRMTPGQTLDYLPAITVTTLNHMKAEWTPKSA